MEGQLSPLKNPKVCQTANAGSCNNLQLACKAQGICTLTAWFNPVIKQAKMIIIPNSIFNRSETRKEVTQTY